MSMLNTGGLTSAMKALLKGETEKVEANEVEKKNELAHGPAHEPAEPGKTEDTQKNTTAKLTFGELRSKRTTAFRRTKNPVILNLLIVSQVKKILKKGLEETKKDNKLGEKKWELLAKEQSKNYKSGSTKQGWLNFAGMGAQGLSAFFKYALKPQETYFSFSGKKIIGCAKQAEGMISGATSGMQQQIQLTTQENNATLEMGSQAASAKFQSDTQQESSDQGLIDQANQLLQELMRLSSGFFTRGFQG